MPCGEYFTSQTQRNALIKWRIQRYSLLLGLPVPFLVPFVLGGEVATLVTVYTFAIAVIGLNIMVGYTGLIVLAQGAFMAIGAYTTSQLLMNGTGLIPALLAGAVLAAITSVIFGLPSYKVKGFYIAITTLALQAMTEWFFSSTELADIHGGSQQFIPTQVALVGSWGSIGSSRSIYYLTLIVLLGTALVSLNISRTSIGRAFRAINSNDLAADVLGINVFKNKLLAFALGGFFVGLAGGLYALNIGFLSPSYFTIELTLEHYIILLLGGLGRVWGAAIGAFLVIYLDEFLREFVPVIVDYLPLAEVSIAPIRLILFGLIIIFVLIKEPRGIIALLGQIKEYFRKWPYAY